MKVVYIDVQNVHTATKKLGWLIDWQKLFVYLKEKYNPDIIYYAVGYLAEFEDHYHVLQGYGYTMLFKTTTRLPSGEVKGNVDIDVAIRSIFDICRKGLQKGYIITNDGDYNTLVDTFQKEGVFGGLLLPDAHSASHLLKKLAKDFVDLQRIKHLIQKQKDSPEGESF